MNSILQIEDGKRYSSANGFDQSLRSILCLKKRLIVAEFVRCAKRLATEVTTFSGQYEQFQNVSEHSRFCVLTHPAATSWIRNTNLELLTCGSKGNLGAMAADFGSILLAAHYLDRIDISVDVAFDHKCSICLPGTGLVLQHSEYENRISRIDFSVRDNKTTFLLEGHGQLLASGARSRLFSLQNSEFKTGSIEINTHDIRLFQNHASDDSETVEIVSDETIGPWKERLIAAVQLLSEFDPKLADEIPPILRTVVPVVAQASNHHVSLSADSMFGACHVSATDTFGLAEELAHESRHNLLNAILSFDSIICKSSIQRGGIWSPWKNVVRPPNAILHTIFAFQEVLWTQIKLAEVDSGDAIRVEKAGQTAARLEFLIRHLKAKFSFTSFGEVFIDGIDERLKQLIELASQISYDVYNSTKSELNSSASS